MHAPSQPSPNKLQIVIWNVDKHIESAVFALEIMQQKLYGTAIDMLILIEPPSDRPFGKNDLGYWENYNNPKPPVPTPVVNSNRSGTRSNASGVNILGLRLKNSTHVSTQQHDTHANDDVVFLWNANTLSLKDPQPTRNNRNINADCFDNCNGNTYRVPVGLKFESNEFGDFTIFGVHAPPPGVEGGYKLKTGFLAVVGTFASTEIPRCLVVGDFNNNNDQWDPRMKFFTQPRVPTTFKNPRPPHIFTSDWYDQIWAYEASFSPQMQLDYQTGRFFGDNTNPDDKIKSVPAKVGKTAHTAMYIEFEKSKTNRR